MWYFLTQARRLMKSITGYYLKADCKTCSNLFGTGVKPFVSKPIMLQTMSVRVVYYLLFYLMSKSMTLLNALINLMLRKHEWNICYRTCYILMTSVLFPLLQQGLQKLLNICDDYCNMIDSLMFISSSIWKWWSFILYVTRQS